MALTILGTLAFLIVFPLAALGFGAFDPRVYDPDDVRRLGLVPLGHVRAFVGDDVGSLMSRGEADDV